MAWIAILLITGFFLVSVAAFFVLPCNVERSGWGCLVRWNVFTKYVLLATPALVCLVLFARKGARIQLVLSVFAIAYDCVLISASA